MECGCDGKFMGQCDQAKGHQRPRKTLFLRCVCEGVSGRDQQLNW